MHPRDRRRPRRAYRNFSGMPSPVHAHTALDVANQASWVDRRHPIGLVELCPKAADTSGPGTEHARDGDSPVSNLRAVGEPMTAALTGVLYSSRHFSVRLCDVCLYRCGDRNIPLGEGFIGPAGIDPRPARPAGLQIAAHRRCNGPCRRAKAAAIGPPLHADNRQWINPPMASALQPMPDANRQKSGAVFAYHLPFRVSSGQTRIFPLAPLALEQHSRPIPNFVCKPSNHPR